MFFKKNNGEPPPDTNRSIRLRISKLSVVLATVFIAGSLIPVNTGAPAVNEPASTENKATSTYQRGQSENMDNLDVESFYSARPGVFLSVNAVNCSVYLIGEAQADAPPSDTPQETVKPSIYNSNIPLSEDLQQYLYDLCEERNLDYRMVLAIILHESSFNPDALGGGCNYGLFQINICHHKSLSKTLNTENTPYDPKTNMNWGTYLLSCIYARYTDKYSGEELTKAVLSAYNKGTGGFEKTGFATGYIKAFNKSLDKVNSWFD